jgi:TPR repeat protein
VNGRGGLEKDDREAARLFKLAADQGNAGGQNYLAVFYANGRGGLEQDDREAARLYKLAAENAARRKPGKRRRPGKRAIQTRALV